MRLLMTGGTGFVGRAAVREAHQRGYSVGLLVREDRGLDGPTSIFALGARQWETKSIEEAVASFGPDAILHLAGGPSVATLETLYENNLFLGLRILEAARTAAPAARTVLVGSAAEYGLPIREDGRVREDDPARPLHPYGIAKLAQTLHASNLAEAGRSIVVARLFNPVGAHMPSGLVFSDVARQIRTGTATVRTGDIDTARDFMPVEEAARVLLDLTRHPDATGIVNVGSGRAQSVRAGIERLIEGAGRPIELAIRRVPGGRAGVRSVHADVERLRMLGIEPASADIDAALQGLLDAGD